MLAIRMQRTGRKGHAMFRVIVQDSRLTPTSGKVVALLGHYDPHAKTSTITKDKAAFYLEHGAQPSSRVARLLKAEGVKLPDWVKTETKKAGAVRNPDKRNKQSAAPAAEATETEPEVTSTTDTIEDASTDAEIVPGSPANEEPAAPETDESA